MSFNIYEKENAEVIATYNYPVVKQRRCAAADQF
jgi:hypothetical protein